MPVVVDAAEVSEEELSTRLLSKSSLHRLPATRVRVDGLAAFAARDASLTFLEHALRTFLQGGTDTRTPKALARLRALPDRAQLLLRPAIYFCSEGVVQEVAGGGRCVLHSPTCLRGEERGEPSNPPSCCRRAFASLFYRPGVPPSSPSYVAFEPTEAGAATDRDAYYYGEPLLSFVMRTPGEDDLELCFVRWLREDGVLAFWPGEELEGGGEEEGRGEEEEARRCCSLPRYAYATRPRHFDASAGAGPTPWYAVIHIQAAKYRAPMLLLPTNAEAAAQGARVPVHPPSDSKLVLCRDLIGAWGRRQ